MPRFIKDFTEREIVLIIETMNDAMSQAEREGNVDGLNALDALNAKLGDWE